MQDFIFGGIESDETTLVAVERGLWRGLRHRHDIQPLDPAPGEPVTLTVYVGPDVHVDRVTAYVTTDGSEPGGSRGSAERGFAVELARVDVRWEALLWDYVEVWQGEIPGQPDGTLVHYRIEGWRIYDAGFAIWSSEPNFDRTVEVPTRYGYHVDTFAPPAWTHESVIYHIFVDRFAIPNQIAEPHRWLDPAEMNDFAGGTLAGITERLDYIVDLGVTAIWLSPIFKTPTYHGYDTTDFYAVDPRFGRNDDLRALVDAAHARGLRVLLDFVANHVSTEFAPFVTAVADAHSPHREWFTFGPHYKSGYRAFFDVPSMPQLATDHPAVRRYLCDAAAYWLTTYDVDGYRLDYAAGPSHAFWSEFRAACKRAKPDCWLFGEVTLAGENLRTYTGRLDGCLDFAFARTVRRLCAHPEAAISLREFASTVERGHKFFLSMGINVNERGFGLPSFLDNHDMNRFLWVVNNDEARLRLAATIMMGVGGPPIIYYGTEVGLSQPRTKGPYCEEARHPMLWGAGQNQTLLAFFKRLIAFRRAHPALWHGGMATWLLDDARGLWGVERQSGADRVLLLVNLGTGAHAILLPPGDWCDLDGTPVAHATDVAAGAARLLAHR